MTDDVDRSVFLAELGYGSAEALAAAEEVLTAAGLTNARKTRIAARKREECRERLEAALIRVCARCASAGAQDGRRPVAADDPTRCERCGGSNNRLAMTRAIAAFRARGYRRLVVVGGAPGVHQALLSLWPADLELRIVEGDDRHHTRADARAQLRWADVVVVWGGTVLAHKVSLLYTGSQGDERGKVISLNRRGVAALAERLAAHLG